jgi:hypothetical protein
MLPRSTSENIYIRKYEDWYRGGISSPYSKLMKIRRSETTLSIIAVYPSSALCRLAICLGRFTVTWLQTSTCQAGDFSFLTGLLFERAGIFQHLGYKQQFAANADKNGNLLFRAPIREQDSPCRQIFLRRSVCHGNVPTPGLASGSEDARAR